MNITQVKIFPVEEEKLKAFVSIVFDHCFMVNDIKVIQGKDGLFLSMPSRRKKSGEFKDVAHPLNNETRRHIEQTVLREYRSLVDDPTPRRPDRDEEEDAESPVSESVPGSIPGTTGNSPRIPSPVMTGTNGSGPGPVQPSAAADLAEASHASGGAEREGEASETAASQTASETVADGEAEDGEAIEEGDPSLEEVQERHLRDSFWSVG